MPVYEALVKLGEGGQAAVWWGRHLASGTPVAVKVFRGRESARAFRAEVRQLARLQHPRVVALLDQGTLSEASAVRVSGVELGASYVVLEHVAGGSLRQHLDRAPRGLSWDELRAVLLDLLEALAHAHARGVLHRDVKPENVLLEREGRPGEGVRLSDFGLSLFHGGAHGGTSFQHGGTPTYMAPEQIEELAEELGPWTDLYALGCVAFELVCGRPPFDFELAEDLFRAHLEHPPPRTPRRPDVPADFEPWVLRLMAKRPSERFHDAAEAARALLGLKDHAASAPAYVPQGRATGRRRGSSRPSPLPRPQLPLTEAWMPEALAPPTTTSSTLGLSLFNFRPPPMVGRAPERRVIWEALAESLEQGRPGVVLLTGPRGSGKTALGAHALERAAELGVAWILRADHAAGRLASSSLSEALTRALRLPPPDAPEFQRALLRRLTDLGLSGVMNEQTLGRALGLRPAEMEMEAGERATTLARLLRALHGERALLLLIDDAHRGSEALAVVRRAYPPGDRASALILLTAPELDPDIKTLLQVTPGRTLALSPLSDEELSVALRARAPLAPELSLHLCRWSEGSPFLAHQLLESLVEQGALATRGGSLALRPDVQMQLPASVLELWRRRLSWALPESSGAAYLCLEVAATLGQDFERGVWREACAEAGLPDSITPTELEDALLEAHLLERRGELLHLPHALLIESLRQESRGRGSWPALNDACARALLGHPDGWPSEIRRGQHLLEAGRPEQAFACLWSAARAALDSGHARAVEPALQSLGACLDVLEEPTRSPRRVELDLLQARTLLSTRDNERLSALAQALCRSCRSAPLRHLLPEALRYRGIAADRAQDNITAEAFHRWAADAARAQGSRALQARCDVHLGISRRLSGDLKGALDVLEEALVLFSEVDDILGVADASVEIARVRFLSEDPSGEVEALALRAADAYRAANRAEGEAQAKNLLGEVYRRRGALEEAIDSYLWAEKAFERLGAPLALVPRANRGLVLLALKRDDEAAEVMQAVLEAAPRRGLDALVPYAELSLAVVAARAGRWEEVEERRAWVGEVQGKELGGVLELLAAEARRAGHARFA